MIALEKQYLTTKSIRERAVAIQRQYGLTEHEALELSAIESGFESYYRACQILSSHRVESHG
jgi:hypothetical protein